MRKKVYLDYAATTPVDPRVLKAMLPFFDKKFGNTMSLHQLGREAHQATEEARKTIAQIIGALPDEIIFTSSATESNNLALKGTAFFYRTQKNHLIVSQIEHECVLQSARWLERQGFEVTYLPVDKYGLVDLERLKSSIKKSTFLVSIIHGNNEVGTVQDISAIGKICRERGILFHTDAAQSLGKEEIDVKKMNIDLLTASSHKIYGPKGAAFLYIRNGIKLEPLLHGGGHEKGLRSSTLNVPAIVGFAKACQILKEEGKKENERLKKLRDYIIERILEEIKGTKLNGHPTKRLSNNINISFLGVEGEALVLMLDSFKIAVSTGSACSSKTLQPSHVLLAMGLKPEEAHGSIRISIGRFTTKEELDYFLEILPKAVEKLRRISSFR